MALRLCSFVVECGLEPCFFCEMGKVLTGPGAIVFKAILTDSHFWVPLVVLLLGIVLLAFLR
jgi:hypothetical protein